MEGAGFPLHQVLIQHTQSFLDAKQAAQTSILSQCWYAAWSTRPNLVFDLRYFGSEERFWEFAKKTIQRYPALNLKIHTFRLWAHPNNCHLTNELIVEAMKMGALDFDFELSWHAEYTLPPGVLGSENLVRLSVRKCKIFLTNTKVSCSKLKSLILREVTVEGEGDIDRDLISNCPLIEKVRLELISGQNYARCGLGLSNLYTWYKLRSLYLGLPVTFDGLFMSKLLSNFPCLKELTLHSSRNRTIFNGIQLSSHSLECITIVATGPFWANFNNVPSIRKFKFTGLTMSPFKFTTTSKNWESDIRVRCNYPWVAWFLELQKLLTSLSLSNVNSLTLDIGTNYSFERKRVDFGVLAKTAVESLTIYAPPSTWFTVLECSFQICLPNFITLHECDSDSRWREEGKVELKGKKVNNFLEMGSKRNAEGIRKYCLKMNHELKEVDVQFFEESIKFQGRRLPLPQKVHLRLRWRGGKA